VKLGSDEPNFSMMTEEICAKLCHYFTSNLAENDRTEVNCLYLCCLSFIELKPGTLGLCGLGLGVHGLALALLSLSLALDLEWAV